MSFGRNSARKDAIGDNLPLAVAVIIFTVFGLSLGDALIKLTSGDFVIWQIFVLRSALALPALLAAVLIVRPDLLQRPPALIWTAIRSLMLVAMWICYYLSLPHLSLAVAAAAYYTLPIFITLFSAAILGERISRLGWAAVALGFMGVLLILRPKAGDFNLYALLPLTAAMLYAASMLLTRTKCRAVHPLILSVALNIAFIGVGALASLLIGAFVTGERDGFLLAAWAKMGSSEWVSMGLLAVSIIIGSVGAAIAYQIAPPSIIGSFDFAYVGFAVLWSAVFFYEWPDMLTLFGMALIVIAGIMSLRQ
ncbi:DMT family transporter [Notoacmeibacter ruber]|uniref:DMT family transporter n=1 Tax=Notoacmeibacter ruber TaxID=2670375 RepID=A0A3L7JCU1_9HYPH|nr:DMT family transporter [Notoacmeibacter ruber]RLQ88274.1 DMT family transporter [Notoacmeibacter ruber]